MKIFKLYSSYNPFLYLAGLSKAGCLVCDDLVRSAQGGCTNRQVCQDTQVGLQIKNLMLRNVITQRRRSSKCVFFLENKTIKHFLSRNTLF